MMQREFTFEFSVIEMSFWGVGAVLAVIALILFFRLVALMFQRRRPLMGSLTLISFLLLGIGAVVALVCGWKNSRKWNSEGLMTAYTITLLSSLILLSTGLGVFQYRVANDPVLQRQIEAWQNQADAQEAGQNGFDVEFELDDE